MSKLKGLIKESFDLWVQMRWLKVIEKETDKRNKLASKYTRQAHVVEKLVEEYQRIYNKSSATDARDEK